MGGAFVSSPSCWISALLLANFGFYSTFSNFRQPAFLESLSWPWDRCPC